MVPKLLSSGQSFAGLAQYLCHDPKSSTKERVAWTHTLNCANDDVPSAINEMFWTYRNAELLKEEAGIRAGGRALEKPVKHFSLNWAPDEELTKEQMVEATESFLKWMKWEGHQVVIVAHSDKDNLHVHGMLNSIHPETGLKLDDSFERRRAQGWALEYERTTGRIYCEQRFENIEDREKSLTRKEWLEFKEAEKAHERAEAERRNYDPDYMETTKNRAVMNSEEWGLLKEMQRKEREAFFAEGKIEFKELRNSIYREVREEFRAGWGEYYQAKRDGLDHGLLTEIRAGLIADQQSVLQERRDAACAELRETRDAAYQVILAEHREARHQLSERQADGMSSPHLLDYVNAEAERGRPSEQTEPREAAATRESFREAAQEVGDRALSNYGEGRGAISDEPMDESAPLPSRSGVRSGPDIATGLTFSMIGGFASLGESLFDGFFGGGSPAPRTQPDERVMPVEAKAEPPPKNPFTEFAEASRRRAEKGREAEDDEWWAERRARTRD